MLADKRLFRFYSKKEASVYVTLAKLGHMNNSSETQIANYYRGAALCYKETNQNYLESATCFYLAGNYYAKSQKFVEATMCYMDAAQMFEEAGKYPKAYELFMLAGDHSLKTKNLESAIEAFMCAVDVGVKGNIDVGVPAEKLVKLFQQYAKMEEFSENFFVAATMYLEAAIHLRLVVNHDPLRFTKLIQRAARFYKRAVDIAGELGKRAAVVYSHCLAILCNLIVGNTEVAETMLAQIDPGNSKTGEAYVYLTQRMVEAKIAGVVFSLAELPTTLKELYSLSEEMRKIKKILFE
jgi:tetratricopeptide (TPR) repeat protein